MSFNPRLHRLLLQHGFELVSESDYDVSYRVAANTADGYDKYVTGITGNLARTSFKFSRTRFNDKLFSPWHLKTDSRLLEVSAKVSRVLNVGPVPRDVLAQQFPVASKIFECGSWLERQGVPRGVTALALKFYELKYVFPRTYNAVGDRAVDFLACADLAAFPGLSAKQREAMLPLNVDFIQLQQQLEAGVPLSLALEVYEQVGETWQV
jgi:hypothetical protein